MMGKIISILAILAFSSAVNAELLIKHIDVDQADSTLIITPSGKALLIDTGGNGDGKDICDIATSSGVSQIDVLITTHYHSDHFGGVDELRVIIPFLANVKSRRHAAASIRFGGKPPLALLGRSLL